MSRQDGEETNVRSGLQKGVIWRQADGSPVSCEEKLKVLNENLAEIRQMCQDAFEDALLMGCEEDQVRQVFAAVIESIRNPYGHR
jgi:hypothetical protein